MVASKLPDDVEEVHQLNYNEKDHTSSDDPCDEHVLAIDGYRDGNEILIAFEAFLAVILLALLEGKAATSCKLNEFAHALILLYYPNCDELWELCTPDI